MMHYWKATAELNMDASKEGTVYFKCNLEKKAWKMAEERLKREYNAFFISGLHVEEISEEEYKDFMTKIYGGKNV